MITNETLFASASSYITTNVTLFPVPSNTVMSDAQLGKIGPQMRQIWDFFRSDFSTFGSMSSHRLQSWPQSGSDRPSNGKHLGLFKISFSLYLSYLVANLIRDGTNLTLASLLPLIHPMY